MPETPIAAETVTITGHNGDEIDAYFARPTTAGPHPGVVVIHHMPGYDRSTKEITRTFSVYGYDAICPNLHYRYAPGAKPNDAAAAAMEAGGVPDDQCIGDVQGAVHYLRALPKKQGVSLDECSGVDDPSAERALDGTLTHQQLFDAVSNAKHGRSPMVRTCSVIWPRPVCACANGR